jgi:hypothetical protein
MEQFTKVAIYICIYIYFYFIQKTKTKQNKTTTTTTTKKQKKNNKTKARHKATSEILAIKIVPIKDDIESKLKEINFMKNCRCDYIVRFYGYYIVEKKLWVNWIFLFSCF